MSSHRILQKVGIGSACAVCCVLPMLLVSGAVTAAALATGGAVFGAITLVAVATVVVVTGRARSIAPRVRLWLFAAGGAGSFAGLWGASSQRAGASAVLALSVAALTATALLALADADLDEPDVTTG